MPHTDVIPTSASIASTGLGIRYVGNHIYAFSGEIGTDAAQSLTAMLEFTTGNHYIIGKWTVCGSVNKDGVSATGGIDQFYLSFNGLGIQTLKTDSASYPQEDSPTNYTIPILIPPNSEVLCQGVSTINNANWTISQVIIGRVYGAE